MATTPEFKYQPMFEHGKDTTEYYLLTERLCIGKRVRRKTYPESGKRRFDRYGERGFPRCVFHAAPVRTMSR